MIMDRVAFATIGLLIVSIVILTMGIMAMRSIVGDLSCRVARMETLAATENPLPECVPPERTPKRTNND